MFAISVKVLFLVLGDMGLATMWEAVFSDVGVTVLAVLNTLRITKGLPRIGSCCDAVASYGGNAVIQKYAGRYEPARLNNNR